jgi:hypothetical protein
MIDVDQHHVLSLRIQRSRQAMSKALIALSVLLLGACSRALTQYAPEPAPEGPPPLAGEPSTLSPPSEGDLIYDPGSSQDAPPPAEDWTRAYPGGLWFYTTEYGWLWAPKGASSVPFENVPYAMLYTPAHGWTWCVSPWGFGNFYFGAWVRHAWHPAGWQHGWIAHPRVREKLQHHAERLR